MKNFSVNFMQILSLIIWVTLYTSVSKDDSSAKYGSDSDIVNISPKEDRKPKWLVLIWKVKMKRTVLEENLQVWEV